MRRPEWDMEVFKKRRQAVAEAMPEGALVIPSHPEYIRNNDVHHAYRQDSNLFYLTGFEEPDSVLVFRPGQNPETILFVRQKDLERETWDGFRYGVDGAKQSFNVDECFDIEKFADLAPVLINDCSLLYYTLLKNPQFDGKMNQVLQKIQQLNGRTGKGVPAIFDADVLLGKFRLVKSDFEIATLKTACEISCQSHKELMRYAKPGMNERELHAKIIFEFMKRGAKREGYGSILAGGANATTLHYVFNDQMVNDGDLLLVDAGAEYGYYTSDITRTYPINGRFSPEQRDLYQAVLQLQKSLIECVTPGISFKVLNDRAVAGLVDIMFDFKFLMGSKEQAIEENKYKKYYPHGVGHWLGLDVHDAGQMKVNGAPKVMEPGMTFTIEPGIYIPANDMSIEEKFRGIGIRIEDNILVQPNGYENLTIECPKEVNDIEKIMAGG